MARDESRTVPVVLLVEPAEDDRAMYTEYLRLRGFDAIGTDDATHGLALAAAADVVVTGIRIHGAFDGVELVRRLREGELTRTKPIVVLTACALDVDRQRARAAGCDVFLLKPCLPDELVAEIDRLLALHAVPHARPLPAEETSPRRGRRMA